MNISLTPQLEDWVKGKVKSGLYTSSSEVVREALRLLGERDRLGQIRLAELRDAVQEGLISGSAGELQVEAIKAEGRKLLADE